MCAHAAQQRALALRGSARSASFSARFARLVGRNLGLGRDFSPTRRGAVRAIQRLRVDFGGYIRGRRRRNPNPKIISSSPPVVRSELSLERRRVDVHPPPRHGSSMAGAFSSPLLSPLTSTAKQRQQKDERTAVERFLGGGSVPSRTPASRRRHASALTASEVRISGLCCQIYVWEELDGSVDAMAGSSVKFCARAAAVGVEDEAVALRSRSRRPSGRHRLWPGTAMKGVVELPAACNFVSRAVAPTLSLYSAGDRGPPTIRVGRPRSGRRSRPKGLWAFWM
nr:unnamed protein product [Digitaria exilis]